MDAIETQLNYHGELFTDIIEVQNRTNQAFSDLATVSQQVNQLQNQVSQITNTAAVEDGYTEDQPMLHTPSQADEFGHESLAQMAKWIYKTTMFTGVVLAVIAVLVSLISGSLVLTAAFALSAAFFFYASENGITTDDAI